jgi:hypothetical protein
MFDAEQFVPRKVAIAAVLRVTEEAQNRVPAHEAKELRLFDSLEERSSLRGVNPAIVLEPGKNSARLSCISASPCRYTACLSSS